MAYENEVYDDYEAYIGAEAAESPRTLLEPGVYPYTVTGYRRGNYGGGDNIPACKTVEVAIDIDGGPQGTASEDERLFLTRKMSFKIRQLFVSVGLVDPGAEGFVPDWNALAGRSSMLRLDNRTYKGEKYNDVKRFLTPAEAAEEAARQVGAPMAGVTAKTAPVAAPIPNAAPSATTPPWGA